MVPGQLIGWGDDPGVCAFSPSPRPSFCAPGATPNTILLHGTASRSVACAGPQGDVVATGVTARAAEDSSGIASSLARRVGLLAYGNAGAYPNVSLAPAVPITVDGVHGSSVTATLTALPKNPCAPPSALVQVVALPAKGGNVLFVIVADQGAAGDESVARLEQVVATLRIVAPLIVS